MSESAENSATPKGKDVSPVEFTAGQSLSYLFDWNWWLGSLRIARAYAPSCMLCGLGLGVLNMLVVLGNGLLSSRMHAIAGSASPSEVDLVQLLILLGVMFIAMLAIVGASFWFIWMWLVRLTAFAHAWIKTGGQPQTEHFQSSIEMIKKRKSFISLTWLFASFYLLFPVTPLVLVVAYKVLVSQEYMTVYGTQLLTLPAYMTSPLTYNSIIAFSVVMSVIALAYTLVVAVFSSVSELSPLKTVNSALRECIRHPVTVLAITAVVFIINLVVSAPYMVLFFTDIPNLVAQNVWLATLANAWLGITSVVLWPLSLTPFCYLVARGIEGSASAIE